MSHDFTCIHPGKSVTNLSCIPVIVVVVTLGAIITVCARGAAAQTHRPPAPKSLLNELDKEDRDCVTSNGGLMKNVSVSAIKLTAKGQHLLVKGSGLCLCGAQNCGFWIYQQQGNNTELLLKGTGAIKVTAGRNSSKGFRDVISESHASAIETIIRTYRYDGTRYQLQKCVSRAFYDNSGNQTSVPLERPCEEKPKLQ